MDVASTLSPRGNLLKLNVKNQSQLHDKHSLQAVCDKTQHSIHLPHCKTPELMKLCELISSF